MGRIDEISEGWVNKVKQLAGIADPAVEKLAEARLKICEKCPVRTGIVCDPKKKLKHVRTGEIVGGCGCMLTAKVRSVNSQCPIGKW